MSLKNFEKILNPDLEINNAIVSLFYEGAYNIFFDDKIPVKIFSCPWESFDSIFENEIIKLPHFNFIIASEQSTIVPNDFLLKYSKSDFTQILGWEDYESVQINALPTLNSVMLNKKIPLPEKINLYPYTSHEYLWLKFILKKSLDGVFIDIRSNMAIIAVVSQKKLLFYNLVKYVSPMDILYYITSAINVTDTLTLDLPLFVSGAITPDSLILDKINPYFKNINFLSNGENLLDDYFHFYISAIELCEL
jgi:hypothetical protein